MFVLNQRVSISSINLLALLRLSIIRNNKIRINKSNIYYRDRTNLKD